MLWLAHPFIQAHKTLVTSISAWWLHAKKLLVNKDSFFIYYLSILKSGILVQLWIFSTAITQQTKWSRNLVRKVLCACHDIQSLGCFSWAAPNPNVLFLNCKTNNTQNPAAFHFPNSTQNTLWACGDCVCLLKCNWHTVNCTYLNCGVWVVLTHTHMNMKRYHNQNTHHLRSLLMLLYHFPYPPQYSSFSPGSHHRLYFLFSRISYKWNLIWYAVSGF